MTEQRRCGGEPGKPNLVSHHPRGFHSQPAVCMGCPDCQPPKPTPVPDTPVDLEDFCDEACEKCGQWLERCKCNTPVEQERVFTMDVCSRCGGSLNGRRCENGHNAYPSAKLEVVALAALTAEREARQKLEAALAKEQKEHARTYDEGTGIANDAGRIEKELRAEREAREKAERERDQAHVEARHMQERLERVVNGSKVSEARIKDLEGQVERLREALAYIGGPQMAGGETARAQAAERFQEVANEALDHSGDTDG